jgi:hypothetical protein
LCTALFFFFFFFFFFFCFLPTSSPSSMNLSAAQAAELAARPAGHVFAEPLSAERLALRRAISVNKMETVIYETDWFKTRPKPVQALMRQFPFSACYVDAVHRLPVRVFGVLETATGAFRLHAIGLYGGEAFNLTAGIAPSDLVRVPAFAGEAHVKMLAACEMRSLFYDPLSWVSLTFNMHELIEQGLSVKACDECGRRTTVVLAK